MVESSRLKKRGFSPTVTITVMISIIIGLLAVSSIIIITEEPFKKSATILTEKTKETMNASAGNLSLSSLQYEGRPYDKCNNDRGKSFQDPQFNIINTTRYCTISWCSMTVNVTGPIYPEYFYCKGEDCCKGFVYKHILNFGNIIKDKFVYVDYYVTRGFWVNRTTKGQPCSTSMIPPAECCPEGSQPHLSVAGTDPWAYSTKKVWCVYNTPANCDINFYYSGTGKESDWHKIYQHQDSLSSVSGKRYQIILPVAGEFKFIKVLSTTSCYISYIEAEVTPWDFSEKRFLDVCNSYYPNKKGKNYLYDINGITYSLLAQFNSGNGYILSMDSEGLWED